MPDSLRFRFNDYTNLTRIEFLVIGGYCCSAESSMLDLLLESDYPLSAGMRQFMADVVSGRLKPKKIGRPSTAIRDYGIYDKVNTLLALGYTLTPSQTRKDSAAQIVAESQGLDVNVVLKAYSKVKKILDELEKEQWASFEHFIMEKSTLLVSSTPPK